MEWNGWGLDVKANLLDSSIPQNQPTPMMINRRTRIPIPTPIRTRIFQLPRPTPRIMSQTWVVVALIKEFQDSGEDFWRFVGEFDAFSWVLNVWC
jgi:hypothetical protein